MVCQPPPQLNGNHIPWARHESHRHKAGLRPHSCCQPPGVAWRSLRIHCLLPTSRCGPEISQNYPPAADLQVWPGDLLKLAACYQPPGVVFSQNPLPAANLQVWPGDLLKNAACQSDHTSRRVCFSCPQGRVNATHLGRCGGGGGKRKEGRDALSLSCTQTRRIRVHTQPRVGASSPACASEPSLKGGGRAASHKRARESRARRLQKKEPAEGRVHEAPSPHTHTHKKDPPPRSPLRPAAPSPVTVPRRQPGGGGDTRSGLPPPPHLKVRSQGPAGLPAASRRRASLQPLPGPASSSSWGEEEEEERAARSRPGPGRSPPLGGAASEEGPPSGPPRPPEHPPLGFHALWLRARPLPEARPWPSFPPPGGSRFRFCPRRPLRP